METPATGMWGPGDYPEDFRTIDQDMDACREALGDAPFTGKATSAEIFLWRRVGIRDVVLDLAEDLDARGLVLCPAKYVAIVEFLQEGEAEVAAGDFTPIDTADADAETGGE